VDASTLSAPAAGSIGEVLATGGVRAEYQPIVDLDSGATVAFEALARGPAGSALESPAALFGAAARAGRTGELDRLCRRVALDGALAAGLRPPASLFVNVEPATLSGTGPILGHKAALAAGEIRVVVEFTERDLSARPAEVLDAVEWLRARGCGIALDDVGADDRSLALLPFLAPNVIKLDMRLIQERTTSVGAAHVINAVAAEVERTGALLLAEGIETGEHLRRARAMGATLGQGWLFGRPGPLTAVAADAQDADVSRPIGPPPRPGTPFELVADRRRIRRGDKRLLLALSRQLEAEALRLGGEAILLATFQEAQFFSAASASRYAEISRRAALVGALGVGLDVEPAPGVRGARIEPGDALRSEWDVVVIGPHFAGAFVARDLGDAGADADRRFDFFVTYDRELALAAARALLARLVPRLARI
jgi:EAL domain-containing protein (putative c-di-GMP-specific phosphodiesterase class I)